MPGVHSAGSRKKSQNDRVVMQILRPGPKTSVAVPTETNSFKEMRLLFVPGVRDFKRHQQYRKTCDVENFRTPWHSS